MEQAGKALLERHADAFGERVADQQDTARRGRQRDVAHDSVAETEVVGDEAIPREAPAILAVEVRRKPCE
jgi:hypothetical protein